ncbi:isoleucine--tRNA ligase [Salinisphaera hydrothermalis]|uniref:Isoleucine--tRNA ligase n=1 Tax=Salinisphaera hydrothermalis (strain C41B8) TaxID=1304275 RepID=A0A084II57_SALHC|nr:isoleucine--tRNA ligase [Salinisphaera hydrothermalis]KEZ76391.1 isoleucyl-tRNA synthetase [Salinisphaera hydrothermalis C41B8]
MSGFSEHKPLNLPAVETEIRRWWDDAGVFEASTAARADGPTFTFYEGPPTANGRPGIHHVLGRTIKDAFCRYKTMRGYRVDRKAGWDTHGLPVEIEVEKELGLSSREDIEAYGIDKYNAACRESVLRYKNQWDELTRRIGYWVDLDAPYVTFSNEYIESVWWLLKQLHEKGLLYKGHKIHWYSPGSGTVLSSHEVSLGYKEVQDPSITVKFFLEDEPDVAILAWTTTPWTMPSNVAVAVGPGIEYAKARAEDGAVYIVAKDCVAATLGENAEILNIFGADALIGRRYKPPYDCFADHPEADHAWRVIAADFITTDDGTGIAHEAPAFGADDFRVTSEYGMPVFNPIERDGHFRADFPLVGGLWFKDADKPIARDLKERGLLFSQQVTVHNYPHDWRKGTPLMNYPVESWFVATQQHKDKLVEYNNRIHWHPPHVGTGRFGDWLANNVDWALSRHRYWGTPLPIWVNDNNPDDIVVIGSIAELREYAGDQVADDDSLDLHKPQVDQITWTAADGGTMRRVPEIIDVWFDSGAMPFAQWHYPFENQEIFEANFPADFICEGVDQTRGWFYSLHAIGTLIKDSPAYKNVIVNGLLLDANGEKMSKSKGNTVDPFEALDEHGADVIRWYMLSNSPPWDNTKYADRGLRETRTKVFGTLENVYSFFATYANIDGFTADTPAPAVAERPELDRWILSRLQSTAAEAAAALDDYNPTRAARAVERFIDALSNWYIRRSRARFWAGARADAGGNASEAEVADKRAAYHTTLTCLADTAAMMAPIAPFFADWLYGQVTESSGARASVHLADFPTPDPAMTDADLERRMALARAIVANTLALRNEAGLNVRQPVARILVVEEPGVARADVEAVAAIVRDEVNVDDIEYVAGEGDLVKRSAKPNFKQLGKQLGKKMKAVAAAVAELDDAAIAAYLRDNALTVTADGEAVELGEGDLLVSAEGVEGWLVGREDGVTVALDSTLTDSLIQRGLAREVINRIQRLRKQAEFHVADRIRVEYRAEAANLVSAIETHAELLSRETLARQLVASQAPSGEVEAAFDVGDGELKLALTREA